jgi:U32 family peptidase
MVELLAPAGDFDSLKAAILNGANAVYLGGKEFSARQFAGNFDRVEMVEAVRFCHCYNAKLYATMNTLYDNNELGEAMDYAAFLYEIGVDALIIQDIGFLKLLREQLPDFELHGSTQMSVHNLEGVNLLYEMGVKRVVLARELSIKEIEYISKNTSAEIEVFIHGALCISFSGQCLFSSMLGGRSGNRGRCAQSCRQKYTLDEGRKAYFLSPKDLSTLEFIKELEATGAASLKIEGRMKKPEYVAGVVNSYKNALKGLLKPHDINKVTQLFNRGGFTSFNLKGRPGGEMMSYDRSGSWGTYLGRIVAVKDKFATIKLESPLVVGDGVENVDADNGALVSKIWINRNEVERAKENDNAQIYLEKASVGDKIYKSLDIGIVKEAQESYMGKDILRLPINGEFTAFKGEKIKLTIHNKNGNSFIVHGDAPQIALKTPTTKEKIHEALSKTKDTPFYFENIDISMEDGIMIPASALNLFRRECLIGLIDQIQGKRAKAQVKVDFKKVNKKIVPRIACITGNLEAAKAALDGECDYLFFGGDELRINSGSFEEVLALGNGHTKILPWIPEIILDEYEEKVNAIEKYAIDGVSGALCGNMGIYSYLKKGGYEVFLSSGFNIFNSTACETLEASAYTLSSELNFKQIKDITLHTNAKTIVTVHGRTKLMVSSHCFIGSSLGHGFEGCPIVCENRTHSLKDRMGETFKVIPDLYCKNHIYNSKILCTIDCFRDIININADYIALNFLDETYEEALLTIKAYKSQLADAKLGHYNLTPDSEQLITSLQGSLTKGHFNRGVE